MMKVLIICEESQAICKAFREKGHEAYSCDIKPCSGGHPEWHFKGDGFMVISLNRFLTESGTWVDIPHKWDLIIAHPPCTYLTTTATPLHSLKSNSEERIAKRTIDRIKGMSFFMACVKAIELHAIHGAIENPVGVMSTCYRKPDQIIEPYQFALDESEMVTKRTCLWLYNLPKLEPINDESHRPKKGQFGFWSNGKSKTWTEMIHTDRSTNRSKTFKGIAKAIAEQWEVE